MKRQPSTLSIILALSFVLRLPGLNQILWSDEAYTAMLSVMSPAQMLAATSADVHPPTWYAIEIFFVRLFGSNEEVVLRLPSLILGMMAVWLTYRLARSIVNENTALITAGLMAVSPYAIYYSNEARVYSLLIVAVLLAAIGAVERRGWLLTFGVALTLLCHNIAILYVPFIAMMAIVIDRRVTLRSLGHIALGFLPWLAWLPTLIQQATTGQVGEGYWISAMTGLPAARLLAQFVELLFTIYAPASILRVSGPVTFSLMIFPLVMVARMRNVNMAAIAALAFGPPLAELAVTLAWQPMILARTLSACLPFWFILIAWWVTLPRVVTSARRVLIGIAAALMVVPTLAYFVSDRAEISRGALDWFAQNAPAGIICHNSDSQFAEFEYYLPGRNVEIDDAGSENCQWILDESYFTATQLAQKRRGIIDSLSTRKLATINDTVAIQTYILEIKRVAVADSTHSD